MGLTDKDICDIAEIEDGPQRRFHRANPPHWTWVTGYADCGPMIEISALWDDTLKKDSVFLAFAVEVAQQILGEKWVVSKEFGKWGAALVADENPTRSRQDMEDAANRLRIHPAWIALTLVTHVFTYDA